MTTESGRGLRALVYAALPPDASPTDTACQPLHRHVLDKAQGDVVALTRERMSTELADQPHVVLTLTDGDLDPATDGELVGLLEQTEGGVLVFGVTYSEGRRPVNAGESCPECGDARNVEISRAQTADQKGRTAVLLECQECGAVWDSWAA